MGGDEVEVDQILLGQGVDTEVGVRKVERLLRLQPQAARLRQRHPGDDAPGQDLLDLSAQLAVVDEDAVAQPGRRPDDWRDMTLILKIETARAVANLPEIIVQAAGRQPTAIMIARGDLSVEIGFARTAEMQEEILWWGEAAAVPVIWATQVLEQMVKTGTPSRGEMTDAAMAARAECVMLNKGPYLLPAIDQLQLLLRRMESNQHKKAPKLRRLMSW